MTVLYENGKAESKGREFLPLDAKVSVPGSDPTAYGSGKMKPVTPLPTIRLVVRPSGDGARVG